MKKRGLVITLLSLIVFIVGCDKVTTSQKSNDDTKTTEQEVDYAQLSSSEKSEMTFVFTRKSDYSAVDLKIINRTSKNVTFDGTKFRLIYPKKTAIDATEDTTLKIDSNSTKTFKNVFDGLNSTDFATIGLYCYKNSHNKLAYSDATDLSVSSTNLKDTDLQTTYKSASVTKKVKKTTTKTPTISDQDRYQNKVPVGQITSGQQAIALIESMHGTAPNGMAYTFMTDETSGTTGMVKTNDGQSVYWVRLFESGNGVALTVDEWTVFPNRTVIHQAPPAIGESNNNQNNIDNNSSTNSDSNNGPSNSNSDSTDNVNVAD